MTKFWVLFFFCGIQMVNAQGILDLKLDGTEQGKSLTISLKEISAKHNATIYFLAAWTDELSFQNKHIGLTLRQAFDQLFLNTDLTYLEMYPSVIVIVKDPTQALIRRNTIQQAISEGKEIDGFQLGEKEAQSSTEPINISGQIVDWTNDNPLPFATIQVNDSLFIANTDQSGMYALTLPPGQYLLAVRYLGYETKIIDLEAYEDGVVNIELAKEITALEEVVVEGKQSMDLSTASIGKAVLNMKELKRAPAFLGESDMIKQIQVLAGVTTVSEAATGFNVRGGSVDQNLILYDGLPIYNSSHALGFLTSINPDAVQGVTFYKGGISAKYGGRASSVLDIQSKDGSTEQWTGKAGIGMITSNIMVNGPIQRDKTAMTASFRSSYSNWLVHAIRTDYANLSESSVSFYDANIKLTHLLSDKTRLSISGYSSRDNFSITGDTTYQWSNLQFSANLSHQFSTKLNGELVLGRGTYGYNVQNEKTITASELSYQIATVVTKAGLLYQHNNHKLEFGLQFSHYKFNPGSLKPTSDISNARDFSLDKQFAIENAFYATDEWSSNGQLFIEAGIRLPMFFSFGPASINEYVENSPRQIDDVIGEMDFKKGEIIKSYFNFEPRLSARWMFDPSTSIKAGYNRIYQYLHLVSNTAAVSPVDIWQPSGYYFKPQRSDQISIGFFKDFSKKKFGFSTEGFYKKLKNSLDFKDGAQLILNDHLETELLQGDGYSYGIETSLQKNEGRLTGSMNYTYSRAFRKIDSPLLGRSVNNGEEYPANFDQPHILNLSWKYQLSKRHFFTGNFTYHTGRPVTIPLSAYNLEQTSLAYFSGRNQYRIPDYHRLDMALVIEGNHKQTSKIKGTWVISVYNVYARKNPYSIFYQTSDIGVPRPFQLSIIGTAFPSISYNLTYR